MPRKSTSSFSSNKFVAASTPMCECVNTLTSESVISSNGFRLELKDGSFNMAIWIFEHFRTCFTRLFFLQAVDYLEGAYIRGGTNKTEALQKCISP